MFEVKRPCCIEHLLSAMRLDSDHAILIGHNNVAGIDDHSTTSNWDIDFTRSLDCPHDQGDPSRKNGKIICLDGASVPHCPVNYKTSNPPCFHSAADIVSKKRVVGVASGIDDDHVPRLSGLDGEFDYFEGAVGNRHSDRGAHERPEWAVERSDLRRKRSSLVRDVSKIGRWYPPETL
jgi:hypothetical protein